jgi:L-serine dehydratase
MTVSVFDLFKIGIGPSSSHTVGPMKAARMFALALQAATLLERTAEVRVELYGSLGATGKGHGSDKAVLLGLEGAEPHLVDIERIEPRLAAIRSEQQLRLLDLHPIRMVEKQHLQFKRTSLPYHPNGMRIVALDDDNQELFARTYYSVGGGFVVDGENAGLEETAVTALPVPYPFDTGEELLHQCKRHHLTISQVMWENEVALRPQDEVRHDLLDIWRVMQECVRRGMAAHGTLPGGMKVRRRAAELYRKLTEHPEFNLQDPLSVIDWVNVYAMAVNEENAAGGRVVTAPTNGAAGIIPAVLQYYVRFVPGANDDGVIRFLLAAGAIGALYKKNASISGADVGCQGEVGVACSMAAAGLAEVRGGTPDQVENAAEIGMEHNLGLTCDPVGGLVQIPCIERNAMGAIKAINAARIALRGDGLHHVSLDKVIKTMRETGADMKTKYKETARGGLAVNVIEC